VQPKNSLLRYVAGFMLVSLFTVSGLAAANENRRPVDHVDPLIDSANSRWFFFSSACRPFGMVNLSPDMNTKAWWKSGYQYNTDTICGFNHVHAWQLSGPSVMQVVGPIKMAVGSDFCRSKYGHDTEVAQAGYHAVTLDDSNIRAELTSTPRVGMHRWTFPEADDAGVLLNLGTGAGPSPIVDAAVRQVDERRIEGHLTNGPTGRRPRPCTVYFAIQFDTPVASITGWTGGTNQGPIEQMSGKDCKALIRFSTSQGQKIQAKVALSYVGVEGARENLRRELAHWDFDRVRRESTENWNRWLSRIEVEGGTEQQRVRFYTDLWHALLGRRLITDVDGRYCDRTGSEPIIRRVPLGSDGRPLYYHYNSDAFWNTFWNLNQLWGIAYPDVVRQYACFMVDMYRNGGLIPRGPAGGNYTHVMIAAHSTPFIVGAYNKGIRGFDVEAAYKGMRKNAFPGGMMGTGRYEHRSAKRGGVEDYIKLGFIPVDGRINESAARTLEYAYDDWCLAQMATVLGKKDDVELFTRRAGNWRNHFDPETRLMRPRNRDGSWLTPFNPLGGKGWCEGNSVQYSWFVPHDVAGLIERMGGRDNFNRRLNDQFEKSVESNYVGKYVHYGNQPSIQLAHLFNYSGAPWLSQKWVREVSKKAFGGTTPELGYRGDEDQGQAGGLAAMMAIGLFQMRGGAATDPVYEITAPAFDRITIQLNPQYYPGKQFTIVTHNNGPNNHYIQSARLDGRPLDRPWFYHRDLVDGGTLELQLGPKPNRQWGSRPQDAPPSMSGRQPQP